MGRYGTSLWTRALLAAVLGTAPLALSGCGRIRTLLGGTSKPSVELKKVRFQDITANDARVLFDLRVSNPSSLPLPLTTMSYQLTRKGQILLRGERFVGGIVSPGRSETVTLPVRVYFREMLGSLEGIRPGSVLSYTLQGELAAESRALGRLAIPVRADEEMPIPAAPEVSLRDVRWERLTAEEARGTLELRIRNRNEFPAALQRLSYSLRLAGRQVADASVKRSVQLGAGQATWVDVPVTFSPAAFGSAMLSALRDGGLDYRIAGSAIVETRFGSMDLPYSRAGTVELSR